jgi:hypothetical protein
MPKRKPVDLFDWFEKFTKSPKLWSDVENQHKCPFPHFKIIPHHERVYIDEFQHTFPFVAWLFQNHNCADFALILQDEGKPGEIKPGIFSIRSYACMTNEMNISGYVTGVLFNDDMLMMEFKLRFAEYIKA